MEAREEAAREVRRAITGIKAVKLFNKDNALGFLLVKGPNLYLQYDESKFSFP